MHDATSAAGWEHETHRDKKEERKKMQEVQHVCSLLINQLYVAKKRVNSID